MKSHTMQILAVILSLTLTFSFCTFSSAYTDEENSVAAYGLSITDNEEILLNGSEILEGQIPEGENPGGENPGGENPGGEEEDPDAYHVKPATKSDSVARIYLCSKLNPNTVSHIFIYVENLTDGPLQVGLITLEKDQGTSMGAFGLQRRDGWGVYINTEAFRFKEADFSTLVALEQELDEAHLAKLNRFLINYNHWDLIINCVFFACGAWNSCTSNYVFPIFLPFLTRLEILSRKHTTFNKMYVPPKENVYYMRGIGKNARYLQCSDQTLYRK